MHITSNKPDTKCDLYSPNGFMALYKFCIIIIIIIIIILTLTYY